MQNQATTLQDALNTRFFAPLRRTRTRRVGVELDGEIVAGDAVAATSLHEGAELNVFRIVAGG